MLFSRSSSRKGKGISIILMLLSFICGNLYFVAGINRSGVECTTIFKHLPDEKGGGSCPRNKINNWKTTLGSKIGERRAGYTLFPYGLLVFPYMVIHLDVGRKVGHAIDEAHFCHPREAQTDEP